MAANNPYLAHHKSSATKTSATVDTFLSNIATSQKLEDPEEGPINLYTGRPYTARHRLFLNKRKELPVFQHRIEFNQLVQENKIVILVGETGSGKTTQIPQFLVHELKPNLKKKMIACTQPRRV